MKWLTSDLHLDHNNIIEYSNRPFDSVESMNNFIISNINKKIKPNEELFILGDFCVGHGKIDRIIELFYMINCKNIHMIYGNHDKAIRKNSAKLIEGGIIKSAQDVLITKENGHSIFLSHYAHKVWPSSHRGRFHCYGHSHGNLQDDPTSLSMDVGVDCNNFTPLSIIDIVNIMSKKNF